MSAAWLNIGLGFIEGVALIVSPCILPILPIILAGSLTGTKARSYGIIIGFILIFTMITLFSRSLIQTFDIPPELLRNFSFAILILLGIVMLSTYLTEKFNLMTERLTSVGSTLQTANDNQSGFFGGFLFGSLVSIIWTPCAGPILAAVIVQIVLQENTTNSLFILLAFALGAALPMFAIALLGRKIISKLDFIRNHTILLRKILGAIIILSVVFLIFNPTFGLEAASNTTTSTALENALTKPYPAPEIVDIDGWINSKPLTLSSLRGKVVLIDFWTYSCINCIRTLPYLRDWYEKYHEKGLEIIGIHSPEFAFEQSYTNVEKAVKKFGILYPVALDNQFKTWRNYNNQYWPAHYLINKEGEVVYEHFGEGAYAQTENNIRFLLGLTGINEENKLSTRVPRSGTPEIYLGYARAKEYAGLQLIVRNQVANYSYPQVLPPSSWALQGKWLVAADKIVAKEKGAQLKLHYKAQNVYAVLGNELTPVTLNVRNQDQLKTINVTTHQLYILVKQTTANEGEIELIANAPGLEIYTFTFGE